MIRGRSLGSLLVLLTIAGLALGACGDDDGAKGGATPTTRDTSGGIIGSWTGKVDGSDAFIAISTFEDRLMLAYVCDSKGIAEWFRGNAGKDALELTSAGGARLKAKLAKDDASGSVTLSDGRTLNFKAPRSTGDAGLYRAKGNAGGAETVGGWIVLPNGEQRGSLQQSGVTSTAPTLNTSSPTVNVGGSTLQARLVNPFTVLIPPG